MDRKLFTRSRWLFPGQQGALAVAGGLSVLVLTGAATNILRK